MKDLISTVKSNIIIAENIYMITLTLPENAGEIKGGQFVNLATGDGMHLLRRPLGVMKVEDNDVTVCYQLKGEGTVKLSQAKAGGKLKILLPLGNGFNLEGAKSVSVIGGGVGIFLDELNKSQKLTVATDDGSYGLKGNAVDAFFGDDGRPETDVIIACGPPAMLKALKKRLAERGIKTPCYVSLEERMGCGIGACLVCVCKTTDGGNARVCKDGPVFNIKEVEL